MLAKSDGTTLSQHIQDCLIVWQQLKNALPECPNITKLSNFWELLFGAVYIHDFGKAQIEFQNVLQSKPNSWALQRHELYSVPFAGKFAIETNHQNLIKRAVLGHHKDFHLLYYEKYKTTKDMAFEKDVKYINALAHPEDFIYNLRKKFHKDLGELIKQYDKVCQQFNINLPFNEKINLFEQKHPYVELAAKELNYNPTSTDFLQNMLFWGALKICDHYGSAGISYLSLLQNKHFEFLDTQREELVRNGFDFYSHQYACSLELKNCLLIAPTGSGKTEAALLWLRGQMQIQGRVFYVLPFTASINAMHKRLAEKMDDANKEFSEIIGLQHSKVPSYLASFFTACNQHDIQKRNNKIKTWRQQLKRMQHPFKIITPFQILKYFYGVKGFEMGFTQLAGAKLVFDEIHAYDSATFAQIQIMLEYITQYLNCRIMIMTATLPTFMINILTKSLQIRQPVYAEKRFMQDYIRHQIIIKEGEIIQAVEQILSDVQAGKRVILVCNTVKRTQDIYRLIIENDLIDNESITLLHSRFHAQDRRAKEEQLFRKTNCLLIGTQAIEVSLDIDYDIMYTEPAPLDALLQRFGRVNRQSKKAPCPVYVFSQGSDADHFIYPQELVERTLSALTKVDVLNENQVQGLLDTVYPDWLPDEKSKYENTKIAFFESLKTLQPYSYPKEREEDFYAQFDGIQVLPARFFNDYEERLHEYDFIGADQLMVSIHKGMYFNLRDKIERRSIAIARDDDHIEKHSVLVIKCRYESGIGLTDEDEPISDNPFL